MLAAAQKFLIQLNRKTTEFYRTAVVRQTRRTCLPLAFRLDLGGSGERSSPVDDSISEAYNEAWR